MRTSVCLVGALLLALGPRQGQTTGATVTPTAGMVIVQSTRLTPGRYRLPATADVPAITVRGRDVDLDLTDVTIEGGDPLADPDGFSGTGIAVDSAAHVTVRGGVVRGYKVGLLARHAPRLHLVGGDFSYNWKPRLWSGIERESLVDWLTYHHNEQDEWLRYGAGIYLAECDDAIVEDSRALQNQNGLLVSRSARLRIANNSFSWNSGLGIGFYRTTDSDVEGNRLDWDVRGYSHGFYNRGQDSAAFLIFEQSSRNRVVKNSATHGGDGIFLWAGQSTMDTGDGGANDNEFLSNDVSHAVANGIEATFSRNRFLDNRIVDCWHGIWGGYSFNSTISRNVFGASTDGIAIEHGQHNVIESNRFGGDETAIRIWANASEDPAFAYAKARDTASHDYGIRGNVFEGNKTAVNLLRTSDVRMESNLYSKVTASLQTGIDVFGVSFEPPGVAPKGGAGAGAAPKSDEPAPTPAARLGRDAIVVDEWGPYDFQSPKLWPAGKPDDVPMKLRVLGPPGHWTLSSIFGATVKVNAGAVPGELVAMPTGRDRDVKIHLEYVGEAVVTPRGARFPAGAHVPFEYIQFDPTIDWHVRYWSFDEASDPVKAPAAFEARTKATPTKAITASHLDLLTSGSIVPGLPRSNVALEAEGTVRLPAGRYDLVTISDDGLRVWIDGRLAVDRWSVHESEIDRATIAGGTHRLRVEYFQATGWAELCLKFLQISAASPR